MFKGPRLTCEVTGSMPYLLPPPGREGYDTEKDQKGAGREEGRKGKKANWKGLNQKYLTHLQPFRGLSNVQICVYILVV